MKKQSISILGSTGSIGLNSLNIVNHKKNLLKINLLSANKNFKKICNQIIKFRPKIFVINNQKVYKKIKMKFKNNSKIKILNNFDKLNEIRNSDITIAAIPGIAGLNPTITMLKKSKKMLIANKESIICGWPLINKIAVKNKTKIVPVDSEHFSIMKLLERENLDNIKKVYITASGGPFLNYSFSNLKKAKPSQAIKHPKWKMGKKISIDSATLMNKMLELVEAQKLFSISNEKLAVIVHPESLVHAIIELKNGLYKFIYHETSMIIPLANAIFEDQLEIKDFLNKNKKSIKNNKFKNLTFMKVDKKRFPIINLKNRINEHISTPTIVNAANEILVDQYLKKKIPFVSFYKLILSVLNDRNYRKYAIKVPKTIDQILLIDKWSRKATNEKIERMANA